ncbi:MAG TPA: DUF6285 domain-containing protein, partial [Nevskiales bacterium]|nr:DUF6285 domain-containing protein [Nevskiales bacterium]
MKKTTRLPDAAELLGAVADFLEQLLPQLEGSQQFNARVSANVLRIVQRELTQPDDGSLVEALQALLGAEGDFETLLTQLAERIRSGGFDEHNPQLLECLRRHTLARLAVDNPKYSSY